MSKTRSAKLLRRVTPAAAALLLAGCSGDLSALDPAGPASRSIALLWWVMLGGATLLMIGVSITLLLAASGRLAGAGSPRALILWGGLFMPGVVLSTLVLTAFLLGEALLPKQRGTMPLRIEASASQWSWEFRYPEAGGATVDALHIPAGRDIDFVVISQDVIHSFWIPRLGGKIDAIPGHANTIRLHADRPGSFGGICAEFCGDGHPRMQFDVIAHDAGAYGAALASAIREDAR